MWNMHCKHSAPTAQHFYGLVGEELLGMWSALLQNLCGVADGLSHGKNRAGRCHLLRSQRVGAGLWGSGGTQQRITEWSGLEGTSVGHPVQPPAEAGSPTAGCTGPRPGGA